jgi:hypothetical protein
MANDPVQTALVLEHSSNFAMDFGPSSFVQYGSSQAQAGQETQLPLRCRLPQDYGTGVSGILEEETKVL